MKNWRGWLWFVALWMVTFAALRLITGVDFTVWQIICICFLLTAWRFGLEAIERRYGS